MFSMERMKEEKQKTMFLWCSAWMNCYIFIIVNKSGWCGFKSYTEQPGLENISKSMLLFRLFFFFWATNLLFCIKFF